MGSLKLDQVSELNSELAAKLADIAINMGVSRASTFLQRCLNVLNDEQRFYPDILIDGDLGAKTLNTLKIFLKLRKDGADILVKMLNS